MIVVVPTIRPEREAEVLHTWHAQTVPHTIVLLRGARSAGAKRNLGLRIARTCGEDWALFADDDNYYGPQYLEAFAQAAPDADVISRGLGFVRHGSDLWRFDRPVGFFPGHSTAVRVAVAPDFPDCTGGEELPWSRALMSTTARISWLPPTHLVYDRSPRDHGYDAAWPEFLRAFGPGVNLGPLPDTYADAPYPIAGQEVSACDEDIFRSLEARAARRWRRA